MNSLNYYLIKETIKYKYENSLNEEDKRTFIFLLFSDMANKINSTDSKPLQNIKNILSNIENKESILDECQNLIKKNYYNILRIKYCNKSLLNSIKLKLNKKLFIDVEFFNYNTLEQINEYKKYHLLTDKALITEHLSPIIYSNNERLLINVFYTFFEEKKLELSEKEKNSLWYNMYGQTQQLITLSHDNKKMFNIYLNLLDKYIPVDREKKAKMFNKIKEDNLKNFNSIKHLLSVSEESFINNTNYIDNIIMINEDKKILSTIINKSTIIPSIKSKRL
jgi:hypothetical protein